MKARLVTKLLLGAFPILVMPGAVFAEIHAQTAPANAQKEKRQAKNGTPRVVTHDAVEEEAGAVLR